MRTLRRATRVLVVCTAIVAAGTGWMATEAGAASENVELSTRTLLWNPDDRREVEAGKLRWAGGIEITSPNKEFGGWSGLAISGDGTTLLAVSDEGRWFSAMPLYDERGRLSGLAEGRMAPMLGLEGEPLAGKALGDAESLVVDVGPAEPLAGNAYVGFERAHRIWRYDLAKDGFAARPEQLLTQRHFGRLNPNGGIEALELLPPSTPGGEPRILAITEDTLDPRGHIKAFVADGRRISRFAVKQRAPYKPTDAALLPSGDLLLLERRFSMLAGVGMQLRLIDGNDIEEGAIVDGEVLLDVGQRYSIDNMEGLAVRADRNGDLLLYVISDDNFNPLQRTLLLMFRMPAAVSPVLAPAEGTLTLPRTPAEAGSSGEASASEGAAPAPN
ncbi:esterase-like activity of phytase family protein [Parvibaculum sp.]|uniref:esterase-like activity of phytase family protein n=2 Tax=Parvibaculum sp. TaxID=2024848 RepID=UPI00272FA6B0|nr:esterase-like activity of phytase family protein [Parvibaculum sp.]